MLSLIHIENMAVIEKCEIEFSQGLNVLTGETGAGKSIIIDSIGALLGNRTSKDIVRFGNKKGSVLGVFTDISPEIVSVLHNYGIEIDDDTLHISRDISHDGKSVCRVNFKPVTVSVLKEISPYLINIHGQHDGQKLLSDVYHSEYLDSFGENFELLSLYKSKFNEYYTIKNELKSLIDSNNKIEDRIDYLNFLVSEIESANISLSEENELKNKRDIYLNYEKTAKTLSQVYKNLNDNDGSAYDLIFKSSHALSGISEISGSFSTLYEKCEDIKYQVEELSSNISAFLSEINYDEGEIEYIEERLDLIYSIKRKYGGDLSVVLENYDEAKIELSKLTNIDKSIEELEQLYKEKRLELIEIGKKLSKKRKIDSKNLEECIMNELKTLDMENAIFSVSVENSGKLSSNGIDNISFLIQANKGDKLKPLAKVASGGELSRIMLAIKNILSKNEDVGTLIFDEIDTGVSGKAGLKIARKLYDVGTKKQVLCVTHLASIASIADNHYLINKSHTEESTFTIIEKMNEEERRREIARIIGGENITETSLKNAEEMIDNAKSLRNKN